MSEDRKGMIEKIKKAAGSRLPEIVGKIPVIGGVAEAVVRIIQDGVDEYRKEKDAPPLYMDWAAFYCKKRCRLSEGQIDLLKNIIDSDYEDDDKDIRDMKSYDIVKGFINDYIGGNVNVDNVDDCTIEDNFLYFIFDEYSEFPYNEDALKQMLNALNNLLGIPIFERYETGGHNESRDIDC